ncbi:hypothetical protein V6N13_097976 [Hibiscus sabdariffa]|uniref:Uncharacterized protein n=1 Tax=Hibiscus sabdariffa TaxID=183260 RepID=A0ABR2NVD6_9ROSI
MRDTAIRRLTHRPQGSKLSVTLKQKQAFLMGVSSLDVELYRQLTKAKVTRMYGYVILRWQQLETMSNHMDQLWAVPQKAGALLGSKAKSSLQLEYATIG